MGIHVCWIQAAARTFIVIVDESKLCDGLAAQLQRVEQFIWVTLDFFLSLNLHKSTFCESFYLIQILLEKKSSR